MELLKRLKKTVNVSELDVKLNRVKITHGGNPNGGPITGVGTQVFLDGVEVKNITRISLTIDPNEVLKVKLEVLA